MTVRRYVLDLAADDQHPPAPGDIMVTARTRGRVTGVREVDSRVWCNRWAITVEPIPASTLAGGARTFTTQPYRRGERPVDVFGPP